MRARDADNLRREDRDWVFIAKNDRVSRLNILGPVLLDDPKHIPAQEDATLGGDRIPADRVEILHTIGKNETKPRRAMSVAMAFLQLLDG